MPRNPSVAAECDEPRRPRQRLLPARVEAEPTLTFAGHASHEGGGAQHHRGGAVVHHHDGAVAWPCLAIAELPSVLAGSSASPLHEWPNTGTRYRGRGSSQGSQQELSQEAFRPRPARGVARRRWREWVRLRCVLGHSWDGRPRRGLKASRPCPCFAAPRSSCRVGRHHL